MYEKNNQLLVSDPEWQISVEGDTMSQIPVEAKPRLGCDIVSPETEICHSGTDTSNRFYYSQTGRQTDKQTNWHGETSIPPKLRWRGYTNSFSMFRNRWKMTPWRLKFHGGVTFSRPLVQNVMLKFEPCQLLTLKNDPGVIFNVGKLPGEAFFNGVTFKCYTCPQSSLKCEIYLSLFSLLYVMCIGCVWSN